eukprot:scaffold3180_cov399-Prasinococcus_capsulatus_cf.AAC.16
MSCKRSAQPRQAPRTGGGEPGQARSRDRGRSRGALYVTTWAERGWVRLHTPTTPCSLSGATTGSESAGRRALTRDADRGAHLGCELPPRSPGQGQRVGMALRLDGNQGDRKWRDR